MTIEDLASILSYEKLEKLVYDRCQLTGTFKLRSGTTSNQYFDKYLLESDPLLLMSVAHQINERIVKLLDKDGIVDVFAGLETGGIPIATALSIFANRPQVIVRKKAKDYGTCKIVEGVDLTYKRVLIIEDVITTGGQVIESVMELRKLGVREMDVACVILRKKVAIERLAKEGLTLYPLFVKETD